LNIDPVGACTSARQRVEIFAFTNLHGCKIPSQSFLCEAVTFEDEVLIGHGVTFINDRFSRATNADGTPRTEADWTCILTCVSRGVWMSRFPQNRAASPPALLPGDD
jgi:hypothetical protein